MFYSLELYSRSILEDYSNGKLTPLSYSLHAYYNAMVEDLKDRVNW